MVERIGRLDGAKIAREAHKTKRPDVAVRPLVLVQHLVVPMELVGPE